MCAIEHLKSQIFPLGLVETETELKGEQFMALILTGWMETQQYQYRNSLLTH